MHLGAPMKAARIFSMPVIDRARRCRSASGSPAMRRWQNHRSTLRADPQRHRVNSAVRAPSQLVSRLQTPSLDCLNFPRPLER
ncbi:MAG TPA: hypothetical protein VF516_38765 [Kofleriaceae bacterium]